MPPSPKQAEQKQAEELLAEAELIREGRLPSRVLTSHEEFLVNVELVRRRRTHPRVLNKSEAFAALGYYPDYCASGYCNETKAVHD